MDMTKASAKFGCNAEHEKAFDKLSTLLCNSHFLKLCNSQARSRQRCEFCWFSWIIDTSKN